MLMVVPDDLTLTPYGYQQTVVEHVLLQIKSRGYLQVPQQLVLKNATGGEILPPPGSDVPLTEAQLATLDTCMAKMLVGGPTGSGKSPVALLLGESIIHGAEEDGYGVVIFVLAPYSLSAQMKARFNEYGVPAARLFTVQEAIAYAKDGPLPSGSYVFAGYEVFNTDKKLVNAENEMGASLAAVVRATRDAGNRIIEFCDEIHVHRLGTANKKAVLRHIAPDLRIGFTATPGALENVIAPDPANRFYVSVEDVKKAKVIVDRTYINDNVVALQKRYDEVKKNLSRPVRERLDKMDLEGESRAFQIFCAVTTSNDHQRLAGETGAFTEAEINLATAVQLSFLLAGGKKAKDIDTDEAMYTRAELEAKKDDAIVDQCRDDALYALEHLFGWTVDNGLVAVYTAAHKHNMEGFSDNAAKAKVIIFKAALALGFDAPRIHSMALLRESKSPAFAMQVVGRATRMPLRKYYDAPELNSAYVYTEYEAMRAIVDNSGGEVVLSTNFGLSEAEGPAEVVKLMEGVTLPNHYNKRGNQNDVKNDTDALRVFTEGLDSLFDTAPTSKMGIPRLLEAGFKKEYLDEQTYASASFASIDVEKDSELRRAAQSGILKATDGSLRRGWEDLTHEAFPMNFVRSAGTLSVGFHDFASVLGMRPKLLQKLVLANETNRALYTKMVKAGVRAVYGEHAGAEFTVEEADTGWSLPSTHRVRGEGVFTPLYHFEQAPATYDSDPEGYMPSIVQRLFFDGLKVLSFYKAEGRGLESVGIPYRMEGATDERLFYPDWMVFVKKGDVLHVFFWETKSFNENPRKQPTPEEVRAKSAGMLKFIRDHGLSMAHKKVVFHGAMLNLNQHSASAPSLAGVRVIGKDQDILEWIRSEGL